PMRSFLAGRPELDRWGPDAAYDRLLAGLQRLSVWQTRRIQAGSLRGYLHAVFAVTAISLAATIVVERGIVLPRIRVDEIGFGSLVPALLVLAAVAVVRSATFVAGVAAAGMVGFGLALVFLLHGAPDLAFTQFAV